MGMQSQISGAAEYVDLTPATAVPLWGFANRDGRSDGVADRIEANALALADASGRTAIVMTFDALFVGSVLDARLRTYLTQVHGVRPDDVLLLASHTHFAPGLDSSKPVLGQADPAYLDEVSAQCEAMLDRLLAKPRRPMILSHGSADWDGGINRRRIWPLPFLGQGRRISWRTPVMAPNPRAPRDRRVRQWSLKSEKGDPIAILWSCACHPTGFPDRTCISSEYPGRARDFLRGTAGPVPVLFLQGFAGDIRQRTPETRPYWRRSAQALLHGPSFCGFDAAGWERWVADLCLALGKAVRAGDDRAEPLCGDIRSSSTAVPLSDLLDEGDDRPVWMRRLSIGGRLDLWAVGAEPSAALADFLPKGEATVALGYLGDVFGYWPTAKQAAEGGYEGAGYLPAFGLTGRLRNSIDSTFQKMTRKLKLIDDEP